MQKIIVTDNAPYWDFLTEFPIIKAEDYLTGSPYQTESVHLINLCQSYEYQTIGYYVSLLAMAQDQKISPSSQVIQDYGNTEIAKQFLGEVDEDIQKNLTALTKDELTFNVYFGDCVQSDFSPLAKKMHDRLPLPLLKLSLTRQNAIWSVKKISVLASQDIPAEEKAFMQQMAQKHLSKERLYSAPIKKQPYFHLAILTDPEEECGPCDEVAYEKFEEAGDLLGIKVDFIDKNDINLLPKYAGLFLRAVPGVDDFTYQFMRRAEQENLALIDDPQTLIKCNDKVYQAVTFKHHHIQTPHTTIVNKYQQANISVTFPCVIKRPDNGFCKDILKADNQKELKKALEQLFKFSDLLVIQAFLPTEFDWRIGVLDRKILFASRYYMAKNHWQVINWAASDEDSEGEDDSLALEDVPEGVVRIALSACDLIGDGLYGVDIKSCDNEYYVIEVNSVPGICHGVEDRALGDDVYRQIMSVFLQRMQAKHGLLTKPYYEPWAIERNDISS
ncbi:MAG: RimK family protein [Legionellaceae bacterium]|nr:RimK family protein [Legionellaceae bacterium]MBP9774936.1 RimK family protein [Legionellaceae bacterium]